MKTWSWRLNEGEVLNGQTKDTDNAEHCFVFPSHCAASIGGIVPKTRASCVETCSIFLHDHTGHNVLERFAKLSELVEALFHHVWCPLVHLVVLIGVSTNGPFHCFFDDICYFINNKCSLFSWLKIIHDCSDLGKLIRSTWQKFQPT